VVYDLINVINGEATLNQALIRDKHCNQLYILAASQTRDKESLNQEGIGRILDELSKDFKYIVCDSPAGIEKGAHLAMYFADDAFVVTNPEVSSVPQGGAKSGAHQGISVADPLFAGPRQAGRNAERGRRAGNSVAASAGCDSGVEVGFECFQLGYSGHSGR
jgi:hypothetical protein